MAIPPPPTLGSAQAIPPPPDTLGTAHSMPPPPSGLRPGAPAGFGGMSTRRMSRSFLPTPSPEMVEARQRGMQLRRQRTEMSSLKAEADARAAELEEQEREAREEVARAEEELERRRVEALKYDGIAKRSEARLEPEMSPGVYALTDPDHGPSRVIAHSIYI